MELTTLGLITVLITGLGLALSTGSHKVKSKAALSIALGSLALISILVLGIAIAQTHRVYEIPLLGMKLGCDAVSAIIMLNVVILGIASLIASYSYCDIVEEPGYGPYYMLMILFLVSMAIIPLIRDWLWFLFMFEVMTLASYFLIGFEYRERTAERIAWSYFITMHVLCTLPLIIAIGMVYGYAGRLDFIKSSIPGVVLAVFLLGFATKSGLVPLHFWLPEAHPVAPTPVSALLSGAMVELGTYGMYRAVELYGPAPPWLTSLMIALAILSTLAAVASYHRQDDIKRLFAWSTIDNAGWMYIFIALGIGGVPLAVYILNHGLAKAAAFLSAGLALYVFGTRSLSKLRGSFSVQRLAIGALIVSIFALEGVPPFNFFWSKFNVIRYTLVTNLGVGLVYALLWVLAFLVFLYIVHRLIAVEHGHGHEGHEHTSTEVTVVRKPPASQVFAIAMLLAILLVSNYISAYIVELIG